MKKYWMILCLLAASAKSFAVVNTIIGGAALAAEKAQGKEALLYKELLEIWKYQGGPEGKAEDKDPYFEKITRLKSANNLPEEITVTYQMIALGGSVKIEIPKLTKEQEAEKGISNKNMGKLVDGVKKDINKVIAKAQFKWKETKDKKTGKITWECEFTDKGLYAKTLAAERKAFESYMVKRMSELESETRAAAQRIKQEARDHEKKKSEREEFFQRPYYFDPKRKLSGLVFHGVGNEEITLTFLSETEVKWEIGEKFTFYDIISRDADGLTIKPKNGGQEKRIKFSTDNFIEGFSSIRGSYDYVKKGYTRPMRDMTGKSLSKNPRTVSFLKTYGPENVTAPVLDGDHYDPRLIEPREYVFLKDGKMKIVDYTWTPNPAGNSVPKD